MCRYYLTLIGTDGTASAEFTLFGRVARQVVGKPVVSLIRSATKNQHGSSGSEFEHMLPWYPKNLLSLCPSIGKT
jgi:hypothetical protein